MDIAALIFGLTFAVVGLGGLLGISLFPTLKSTWPYSHRLFLGNLSDTRRNRAVISSWLIGAGLYVAFSRSLHGSAGDLALAGFVLLAVLYLLVRPSLKAGS